MANMQASFCGVNSMTISTPMSRNCGKEGGTLNTCTLCKSMKYCNVACHKTRQKKHKKECNKHKAVLYEKRLFGPTPPREDCPVCFVTIPYDKSLLSYNACCVKLVCIGCALGQLLVDEVRLCPFCRDQGGLSRERLTNCVEHGDEMACSILGRLDKEHAVEIWSKGVEFGSTDSCFQLALHYEQTDGEGDEKKTVELWEKAAMGGV